MGLARLEDLLQHLLLSCQRNSQIPPFYHWCWLARCDNRNNQWLFFLLQEVLHLTLQRLNHDKRYNQNIQNTCTWKVHFKFKSFWQASWACGRPSAAPQQSRISWSWLHHRSLSWGLASFHLLGWASNANRSSLPASGHTYAVRTETSPALLQPTKHNEINLGKHFYAPSQYFLYAKVSWWFQFSTFCMVYVSVSYSILLEISGIVMWY